VNSDDRRTAEHELINLHIEEKDEHGELLIFGPRPLLPIPATSAVPIARAQSDKPGAATRPLGNGG